MKKNKIQLLISYTKNVTKERGIKKGRIFFLRSLLYAKHSFRWLKFIDLYYLKYGFEHAPWTLVGLLTRSYVSSSFGISKKITMLKNHYQILAQFLDDDLLKKLLAGDSINLSNLTGKNGESYSFNMAILDRYWREGGLTIFMSDTENNIITTITFNFDKTANNENLLFIGGLQGGFSADKSTIVSTTRSLNGLRPKYAVLEQAYAVAEIFKVKVVAATSLTNHIFNSTRIRKKIYADYDQFWLEIGGVKSKDKNFILPIPLPKRSIDEVQSKRKKDWLKRQEYLEKIKQDAKVLLSQHLIVNG